MPKEASKTGPGLGFPLRVRRNPPGMARIRKRQWVVTHCEFFLRPKGKHIVDEMPFYATSSLRKAIRLIRRAFVDQGTWWCIYRVSDEEGPEWWRYYSRTGRQLPTRPDKQGIRGARAETRRHLRHEEAEIAKRRREGASIKELKPLIASVRWMRACLQ